MLGRSALVLFVFASGCSRGVTPHESARPAALSAAPSKAPETASQPEAVSPAPIEQQAVGAPVATTAPPSSPLPAREAAATAAQPSPKVKAGGTLGLGLNGIGMGAGGRAAHADSARATGNLWGAPAAARPSKPAPLVLQRDAKMNTENYAHHADNPFLAVGDQPLSTFSVDVDTASYSNARRFLNQGALPPKDSIRVEEWLNYFSYDYGNPAANEPFSVTSEVASCPWNPAHRLLRLGLKTQPISQAATPPRNLVFLIDVSGSMMPENKLPLLKRGLSMLAENLRAQDSISIVVYAGASGLALPTTRGDDRAHVLDALGHLEAGGSTNGGDGIRLAYSVASAHFIKGGINRVILATDGDFNVGTSSEGELERLIEDERKSGVFLTVLGFGEGNVKDSTMEMLADKGNGNYAYVDSIAEARKVLVEQAGATLVTVAKDVKLQVEFNPARVDSYRLIGYEDRVLAKEDFNDDRKDAGDMGAGHSVTALYEVIPKGEPGTPQKTDPLKYQTSATSAPAAASSELCTVNIRYKAPNSERSQKFSRVVTDANTPAAQASPDFRFGVAVAEVALVLRGAPGLSHASLDSARALAEGALGNDTNGERHEFISLLAKAKSLSTQSAPLAARAE
ncbi:MAG TPA: von Willebrand factor type A domain-containing protein [Polyangiaceae bacterium]